MPTDRLLVVALALVLAACEEPEPPPFAPEADAGTERPDGAIVIRIDAGRDAGVRDAGAPRDGALPDASSAALPVVDGIITDAEWAGALEAINETPPSVLPDRLTRLLVRRTDARLFVAIEGSVDDGRAMLLLLDADYGSDFGVVLNGTALADNVGSLDSALSSSVFSSVDPDLRPDYAWGALGIPLAIDGSDGAVGWREIASRSDDFVVLTTGNRSACSLDGCETSIALGPSGIVDAQEIAIAVRTGSEAGLVSNQTLPMDASGSFESISTVLRVPATTTF